MSELSEYLSPEDILFNVQASSKRDLFLQVGKHMERVHGVSGQSVAAALQRRELAGSTSLGHGVAIPHARVKEAEQVRIVYVRLLPALVFDSPGGDSVSDVVVIIVPGPAVQVHLDILSQVASLFSDHVFRKALYECHHPFQLKELVAYWPH